MHVTEFGITGVSFEPQTVWIDDEDHFFGVPGTWFSLLREGWENDQLYALDLKARDERNARLQSNWHGIPHTRSRSVLTRNWQAE